MKNEIFLSVEGLSKRYGGIPAVDKVSFSMYKGGFLACLDQMAPVKPPR